MSSLKKTARIAGALYFLACIPAPFSLLYVPNTVIVRGNATATASSVLAHETLFRLGIVGDLLASVTFMFVVLALYRLLSGVNTARAAQMVAAVRSRSPKHRPRRSPNSLAEP